MIDTVRQVTTPELIELQLHPAGVLPRSLAWIIDLLLRMVILLLASLVLESLGEAGLGMMLIVYFAQEWFYPVLFEVLNHGSTPGKKALGLVVLYDDGTPVGWAASFTRNLLRTVDFLPFAYLAGLFSMIFHKEFRRLGDIVANTVVCYREPMVNLPAVPEAMPVVPDSVLNCDTQLAILAFAERVPFLTADRQRELARLVPFLARSESGVQGVPRLLGLANFIVGRRK